MAVISYRYDDRTQLSPHFNVQEFHCKCGQNHDNLKEGINFPLFYLTFKIKFDRIKRKEWR